MLNNLDVDLSRCVCVHSMLQVVDQSLQILIYFRGLIPQTYAALEKEEDKDKDEFKYCENFEKVRAVLKEVFRSRNRQTLREVMILFGHNHIHPEEAFFIDVSTCDGHEDAERGDGAGCSENCSLLSKKDQRTLYTRLVLRDGCDAQGNTKTSLKTFIMIKLSQKLDQTVANLEWDEDYEPPSLDSMRKRQKKVTLMQLKSDCDRASTREAPGFWYRIPVILHPLKHAA